MAATLRSPDRSYGDVTFAAADLLTVGSLTGTQLLVAALANASALFFRLVPRSGPIGDPATS